MTPYDITGEKALAIYKGALWTFNLLIKDTATGAVQNLSGKTFVLDFKSVSSKSALFSGTAVLTTDGTDGYITITATAAQTATLTIGSVWVGLRDQYNNAYLVGELDVKYTPNDPA